MQIMGKSHKNGLSDTKVKKKSFLKEKYLTLKTKNIFKKV